MSLEAKHILITGASSGIGRQCALDVSQLGAKVTLVARDEERLNGAVAECMRHGGDCDYRVANLSNTDSIKPLIEAIVTERGAIDGFVHAAGISDPRMLRMAKPAFVEKMFAIHVFAFIEAVRTLSLQRNLNDGASIVGISSVAAEQGGPAQCVYAAAKAAMNGFVKPAAAELGARGIRVNTVAYGAVDTRAYKDFVANADGEGVMDRQYLGIIDVAHAASAIVFLLDDSSRFMTGSTLPMYGGYF